MIPKLRSKELSKESLAGGLGCLGLLLALLLLLLYRKVNMCSRKELITKLTELLATENLGIGVETEENSLVDKRVLLLCPGALLDLLASGTNDRLDLVRVDETSNVGVGDLGGGEEVVALVEGSFVKGAKDLVEESKSTLGPDDEAAEVTTWGELEEIEATDVDELNTWKIAECLDDTVVLIVHNERTTALAVPAVPHLALAGAELARVGDLDNIGVGVEGLEESDCLPCLFEGLCGAGDDERDLLDLLDAVATSKDERGESRRSKGRNNSKAALVLIDLDVPLAPRLSRSKHASSTAHVTECGLILLQFSAIPWGFFYIPDRNGGFLLHRHGEYVLQHDQYPKTRRWSGGQPSQRRHKPAFCSLRCSLMTNMNPVHKKSQTTHCAPAQRRRA